jgi:hypothetical protein
VSERHYFRGNRVYETWPSQMKSALDTRREIEALGLAMIDDYERGLEMGKEKVHHTLPIANVTACGLAVTPTSIRTRSGVPARGIVRESSQSIGSARSVTAYSYDLSEVTCEECAKRLTTPVTDAETARAVEDAGWLRTQGEDFHSLRLLVEAVNETADVLEDRERTNGPWDRAGDRAVYVFECRDELRSFRDADDQSDEDESDDEEENGPSGDEAGGDAPIGGLSHDHTNWLVRKVRGAITDLRAGQAWPDDARRVAAELEDRLDKIFGKQDESKS